MATSIIKASDIVSNNIYIPNQDTTYIGTVFFRKIGRVVYIMSRAIRINTAITSQAAITLGTVPDEIKPLELVEKQQYQYCIL